MNIKPMLVRLQGTLDRNDLSEKMLLLPGVATTAVKTDSEKAINLVVGYYLAQEWGGNLKTHLCCGSVSTELRRVVEVESADLLFLGCSVNHPVIQELGDDFPCPVLGIPKALTVKQAIEEKIECLMQPSNFG